MRRNLRILLSSFWIRASDSNSKEPKVGMVLFRAAEAVGRDASFAFGVEVVVESLAFILELSNSITEGSCQAWKSYVLKGGGFFGAVGFLLGSVVFVSVCAVKGEG